MPAKPTDILDILETAKPFDKSEEADIIKMKKLILTHKNIFHRDCANAHVTASALVVNPNSMLFLLHRHKKLNKWLQFGGHADGETNLPRVALKEAQEESDLNDLQFFPSTNAKTSPPKPIDMELQTIPKNGNCAQHLHLDFRFLLLTKASTPPLPNISESQQLSFFSLQDLAAISKQLDPALNRLIRKSALLIKQGTYTYATISTK